MVVFGKLLVVGAQVLFGTNHPAKVLVFMIFVFAGLCTASFIRPPYYDRTANNFRHFLDFGVLWVQLATLVFYETSDAVWVRVVLPVELVWTAVAIPLVSRAHEARKGNAVWVRLASTHSKTP